MLKIERLNEDNFSEYERLTGCENDGGCFCAMWHQRRPYQEWNQVCRDTPLQNRDLVREKMRSGFHVGVLAFQESSPERACAWVSIAPVNEFYWSWPRVAALGRELAPTTACIPCWSVDPAERGKGLSRQILPLLLEYARAQGWKRIEAYPFDESTVEQHGPKVLWPGPWQLFEKFGFTKSEPHWLSQTDWARSIWVKEL